MDKVLHDCGVVPHPKSYFVIPMKEVLHLQTTRLQSSRFGKKEVVMIAIPKEKVSKLVKLKKD